MEGKPGDSETYPIEIKSEQSVTSFSVMLGLGLIASWIPAQQRAGR
jgi:hypothetical protein